MSTATILCAACGADVPYGRLSCPDCGELLASVAGKRASTERPSTGRRSSARSSTKATERVPASGGGLDDLMPGAADDLMPGAADAPFTTVGTEPSSTTAAAPGGPPSILMDPEALTEGPSDEPESPGRAADVEWPSAPVASFPAPQPAPAGVAALSIAAATATPGAYVPPVLAAAGPAPSIGPAPARAWGGHGTLDTWGPADASADTRTSENDDASVSVDRARLEEFAGWLAVAGAALAAVGFLLPWSMTVIGAVGVGYFDRWGLAGPGHPFIVLALLAILALALVKNPLPMWLRVGIPALAVGALLIGLGWVYLFGPLRTDPGVYAVMIGALLLMVAGILAIVSGRNEVRPSGV